MILSVEDLGFGMHTLLEHSERGPCEGGLTDVRPNNGIQNWDVDSDRAEHKDLDWLNKEVANIEKEDPQRQIVILTHHSPTTDSRANNPIHQGKDNDISSGFVTDLSLAKCWTSPQVRLWAFRHTRYSFSYQEEGSGKFVVANQGYCNQPGQTTPPFGKVQIVEASDKVWELKTIETQSEAWKPGNQKQRQSLSSHQKKRA